MKRIKQFAAMLMSVIMALAVASPAVAADVEVKDPHDNHTYEVYQIFAGTQGAGAELAVNDWGNGIDGAAFLAALKDDARFGGAFAAASNAKDVAKILSGKGDNSDFVKDFASVAEQHLKEEGAKPVPAENHTITLDAGYYLIVDTTVVDGQEKDARNPSVLQVTQKQEFTVKDKYTVPTVTKKVHDVNDSVAGSGENPYWLDSADHDIGDLVKFQVTGTLPNNLYDYDTYFYEFQDTLSEGFDAPTDIEIAIKYGDQTWDVTDQFNKDNLANVTCSDIKPHVMSCYDEAKTSQADLELSAFLTNAQVEMTYSAKLNDGAKIGAEGNPNEVVLYYSNNPSYNGTGDKGHTPKDRVIVFTYQLTVNKQDPDHEDLSGATFTLYKTKDDGTKGDALTQVPGGDGVHFEFRGLDDGVYILEETTAPDGYNKIDDITLTIDASHDSDSADPKLTDLSAKMKIGNGNETDIEIKDENIKAGLVSVDVVNEKGATLPETGGMGTTIFYVLGSVMVVGFGVLLVAKKRMSGM